MIDIRNLITTLESTAISMEKNGHKTELDEDGALFYYTKERLSKGLLRLYIKWTLDKERRESFHSLIEFLSEWSTVLESSSEMKGPKMKQMISYSQCVNEGRRVNVGNNDKSSFPYCPFHKRKMNSIEKHYLDVCPKFKALTAKDKKEFVFNAKLCRLCLKPNHIARDCTNKRNRCPKCPQNALHHFLLHDENYSQRRVQDVSQNSNSNDILESHNVHMHSELISLQTVPIRISNGNRSLTVNALLDIGSNSSFVSQSVIEELQLKPYGTEMKALNTMNQSNKYLQVSKVEVTIQNLNGNFKRKEIFLTTKKCF